METRTNLRAVGVACAALVAAWLVLAAPASASSDMQTVLQDDPHIVYEDDGQKLDDNLATIAALGVDTIRVSLYWHLVAPNPTRRHHPDFGELGASDPAAYPPQGWRRYDRIVKLAAKHDLSVFFTITGPAPRWATHSRKRNINNVRPDPRDFRAFVKAVGKRYSGTYPDPDAPVQSQGPTTPSLPVQTPTSTEPASEPAPPLPRVEFWSVWNEPNFPTWLYPQRKRFGRHGVAPASTTLYRRLVEAAYSGLADTGHSEDVILIGETAPRGAGLRPRDRVVSKTMAPLMFLRELYCVDSRYRRYRGRAARRRGCPSTAASRRRFVAQHPGLFKTTGWAHHPYSLNFRPTWQHPSRDAVSLGSLNRLTRALDRIFTRWGQDTEWPVYITEYGYQTNPPDRYSGVSWSRQAEWTSWAEYLAYRNPRVASFAQFLLYDDAPKKPKRGRTNLQRWITWQSGLFTRHGTDKPLEHEFPYPIHATPARGRHGRSLRVFGIFRPAAFDTTIDARIQFAGADGVWRTLAHTEVDDVHGYLLRTVRPPGSGRVRILWTDPTDGSLVATRSQPIVRR